MNKPVVVLGSIAFSVCTAFAQSAPTPPPPDGAAPAAPSTAAATRHGRVQGVIANPDGSVSGLFLGGHTAVSLTPELSHQLAAMRLRGREVTASGPSQTIGGFVTVDAQTLRVGGNTFTAAAGPQMGLAAPPRGQAGALTQVAGLRRGPAGGPGAPPPPPPPPPPGAPAPPPPPLPPNGIAPPPPPPPNAAGGNPRATPPPAPPAGAVPPPPADGRNQAAVPPPAPTAAPGVNGASPTPPPTADGSQPAAVPAPQNPPQQ